MKEKKGLFIVFEGIDGAGTSTQVPLLTKYIKELDKYADVLETHEPWRSSEIKRKLREDKDSYRDGLRMAELFIDDRVAHTKRLIRPNLDAGAIVISDRYKMSTCSYQWAQGVKIGQLLEMHEDRALLRPDLTFYIYVPAEVGMKRVRSRLDAINVNSTVKSLPEKFEKDQLQVKKQVSAYDSLADMAGVDENLFGKVVKINGERTIEKVAVDVRIEFDKVYQEWLAK